MTLSIHGEFEICILAGGLSRRMGRNKARVRLGQSTLLGLVRSTAQALTASVRVIRRDLIPGHGPLGGIYTALKTSRAPVALFLSCDMPFVSRELLESLLALCPAGRLAAFISQGGRIGFPFWVRRGALRKVQTQLEHGQLALADLAHSIQAQLLTVPPGNDELLNVNTPSDLQKARKLYGAQ